MNESKQSPTSGSADFKPTKTSVSAPSVAAVIGIVRLRSLLEGGGAHAGSGLSVPAKGVIFESDLRGLELVAAGLAEVVAPEGAKGE